MPFALKKAGATYQSLVNHMFKELIKRSIKVYVDDLLIKSKEGPNHLEHLAEAVGVLRRF